MLAIRRAGLDEVMGILTTVFDTPASVPGDRILSKGTSDSRWKQLCLPIMHEGGKVIPYQFIGSGAYGIIVRVKTTQGRVVVFKVEKIMTRTIDANNVAFGTLIPMLREWESEADTISNAVEFRMHRHLYERLVATNRTPYILIPELYYYCRVKNVIASANDATLRDQLSEWVYKNVKVPPSPRLTEALINQYVSVTLMESAVGALDEYIQRNRSTITVEWLRGVFFRVIYTLAVIQDKVKDFKHHDLHMGNVLIVRAETGRDDLFNLYGTCFHVPSSAYIPVLADFGLAYADMDGLRNPRITDRPVHGWGKGFDGYYDLHTFFNGFLNMVRKFALPGIVTYHVGTGRHVFEDRDLGRFMNSMVPDAFKVTKYHGRIRHNTPGAHSSDVVREYRKRAAVNFAWYTLKKNPFFAPYLISKNVLDERAPLNNTWSLV